MNPPYSTRLRTALVLTGTGTAGAYHAGVLRAFREAGVRVDLVAGRGVGAAGALFAAVDGGQRLWESGGLWRDGGVSRAYRWRQPLRVAGGALVGAAMLLAVPLVLFAVGVVAALIAMLLSLATLDTASKTVTSAYASGLDALFAPAALPTIVPRLIVLCLLIAVGALAVNALLAIWRAPMRRRMHRRSLWNLLGAPLTSRVMVDRVLGEFWNLIRGAAPIAAPPRQELAKRYIDLLAENVGQPGFRELLLLAHDLDSRRDLVFAMLSETHRARFFSRTAPDGSRAAEAFDLAGVGRDYAIDALAASLAIPLATSAHLLRFPAEGPWRGETHRACDRPSALGRLLEEAAAAGAEQVIILSAAPAAGRPHELRTTRADPRGLAGEQLAAFEAAELRDAVDHPPSGVASVYVIRPSHNPVGPLDFGGVYDERSDRPFSVAELVDRGYEDAYHQFIEPVVGAGEERVAEAAIQS